METQKALIYCRVSSDKQVSNGDGLGSQEQRCRIYAEQNNYKVMNVFPDEGISGALFERPAMRAMINYLDKYPYEKFVIIFDDLSRFARDVAVHLKLKTELVSRGAILKCLNYNFDDSPEGEYIELMFAGGAELARKQNKRQVIQKMKSRIERGLYCFSAVPCGMEYKKTIEHGLLLHPKEPEASIIREALEGFANGRFIMQMDVLNFLLAHKGQLADSGKINLNFVKRTLSTILYAGYVEYAPWEITRRVGHHEALVSTETYEKIEVKLGKAEKKVTTRDSNEFPLRKLVYCSACGEKMTGANHKAKSGKYHAHYTCNKTACTANPKNIKKIELENEYKELLGKIAPESEIIDLTRVIALDVWQKSMSTIKSTESLITRENEERNKQIENYLNLASKASSDFVREKYEMRAELLEKENLASKKQTPSSEYLNCDVAIAEVLDFLGTPDEYWQKTNLQGKFMVHDLIFTSNLMYDAQNGFGTPEISLPFTIKDAFSSASSRRVDKEQFPWNHFLITINEWWPVVKRIRENFV